MKIHLNGRDTDTQSETLWDLVKELGYDPASLVAEVNRAVVQQDHWKTCSLSNGDTIELLSFVGGG